MAKGSMFLKVVGIVMIVCGAIATIVDLLAVIGSLFVGGVAVAVGANPTLLILTTIVALISAVAMLIAGIIGVVNANNTDKAQLCLTFGAIVAALSVVGSLVMPLISGGGVSWIGLIFGLVLPGLFIYGAILNKQS